MDPPRYLHSQQYMNYQKYTHIQQHMDYQKPWRCAGCLEWNWGWRPSCRACGPAGRGRGSDGGDIQVIEDPSPTVECFDITVGDSCVEVEFEESWFPDIAYGEHCTGDDIEMKESKSKDIEHETAQVKTFLAWHAHDWGMLREIRDMLEQSKPDTKSAEASAQEEFGTVTTDPKVDKGPKPKDLEHKPGAQAAKACDQKEYDIFMTDSKEDKEPKSKDIGHKTTQKVKTLARRALAWGMLWEIRDLLEHSASDTKSAEASAQEEFDTFVANPEVEKEPKPKDVEHKPGAEATEASNQKEYDICMTDSKRDKESKLKDIEHKTTQKVKTFARRAHAWGMLGEIRDLLEHSKSDTKSAEASAQKELDTFMRNSKVDEEPKPIDVEHKTDAKAAEQACESGHSHYSHSLCSAA